MKPLIYLVYVLLHFALLCHCQDSQEGDIEIVGYLEKCEENILCDQKAHLVCDETEKICICDKEKGFYPEDSKSECTQFDLYSYVENTQKEEKEEDASESDSVWPQDPGKWALPEFGTGSKLQKADNNDESSEISQALNNGSPQKSNDINSNEAEKNDGKKDLTEEASSSEEKQKSQSQEIPAYYDEDYFGSWSDAQWYDNSDDDHNYYGNVGWCVANQDCVWSSPGIYSECDTETGFCKCVDTEGLNRDVIVVNGTCYVKKTYGDPCSEHAECDLVIDGPAWCHVDIAENRSYCTCQSFSIWDPDYKECLPIATQGLESSCKNDLQCSDEWALGEHGHCSEVTGLCECATSIPGHPHNIVFYDGKCISQHLLKDQCATDQECRASLGPYAYCDEANKCSCLEGHICSIFLAMPSMSIFTIILLLGLVILLITGTIFCVLLKRHESNQYSYIQQRNEI